MENVKALVVMMNWVYIVTYWPVIMVAALILFIKDRPRYNFYRTVVLIDLAGALLTFMLFPVASPFSVPTVELLNTIQEFGPTFYGSDDMASLYNISAAMPSLHFSWTVILGVLFWKTLSGWHRVFGLVYPVLTFLAIVLTGNHRHAHRIAVVRHVQCTFARWHVVKQVWHAHSFHNHSIHIVNCYAFVE